MIKKKPRDWGKKKNLPRAPRSFSRLALADNFEKNDKENKKKNVYRLEHRPLSFFYFLKTSPGIHCSQHTKTDP